MSVSDRSQLHFVQKVRESFLFLVDEGFTEVEALPTLVRYRNGDIEVDIYHGRLSYEVGCGITMAGTRYAISEIVRVSAPEVASNFRYTVAKTPKMLTVGIEKLSVLMQRYGAAALYGDSCFFSILEKQRKQWSQEYALDVLAGQLRPQAEDAFRRGDYSKAAELYGYLRECLSPAEAKKLAFAEAKINKEEIWEKEVKTIDNQ